VLQSKTARWSTGTALLCVVLLAIAWFLVVAPRRADAAEVQAEVLGQQQQNDQLRTSVEQLKAEFVQLPATRAKLAEIRNQLPPTQDVPGLLRTVESLATAAGVKLVSFTPGPLQTLGANGAATTAAKSGSGTLTALPLTLTLTGEYFQVVTFLRQLQTGVPRAFLVSGLQIAKPDGADGSSSDSTVGGTSGGSAGSAPSGVKVTISAKVFSMPTTATQAAVTAAGGVTTPLVAAGSTPTATVTPTPAMSASTPSPSTGAIALPGATRSARW
jgi:Tfp pilus assembly protein PilO